MMRADRGGVHLCGPRLLRAAPTPLSPPCFPFASLSLLPPRAQPLSAVRYYNAWHRYCYDWHRVGATGGARAGTERAAATPLLHTAASPPSPPPCSAQAPRTFASPPRCSPGCRCGYKCGYRCRYLRRAHVPRSVVPSTRGTVDACTCEGLCGSRGSVVPAMDSPAPGLGLQPSASQAPDSCGRSHLSRDRDLAKVLAGQSRYRLEVCLRVAFRAGRAPLVALLGRGLCRCGFQAEDLLLADVGIQWAFSGHSVGIQWACSGHAVCTQCARNAHAVCMQYACSVQAALLIVVAQGARL